MPPRNWKYLQDYLFTGRLSKEQWAWEFLRRNPEYQAEWMAFHGTWKALEADYGTPGDRDFCAWKEDPRAWVPVTECEGADCRVDQDKVLIECALGARWGFHKFPPDPADDDPVGEGRLNWRTQETGHVQQVTAEAGYPGDHPSGIALEFDLTLPLRGQLEQAKRFLQMTQRQRVRQGIIRMNTVAANRSYWELLLRLLDGQRVGAPDSELELLSEGGALAEDMARAAEMTRTGYRRILLLPE